MKKLFILLLASFYLIIASGLTVSLHYCGGKLKKISFFTVNDEAGCCGTKEKSKDCCHEKTAFIKVNSNHFSNSNLQIDLCNIKCTDAVVLYQFFELNCKNTKFIVSNYHSPPVLYDNPIYLKHRVLII